MSSDDGWKSRKLWATFTAMACIVAGFVMVKDRGAVFGEYVAGILTAGGLFKAANLVEKLSKPTPDTAPEADTK